MREVLVPRGLAQHEGGLGGGDLQQDVAAVEDGAGQDDVALLYVPHAQHAREDAGDDRGFAEQQANLGWPQRKG